MNEIYAIIPIYVENIGNAVEIYLEDRKIIQYYSLDCCIKKIAKNELIDLIEMKKIIKKSLNITKNPPVCLKTGTYCMIKVRKTISKNDGSYGLFNINSIKETKPNEILLKNNTTIKILESKRNVDEKIRKARLARIFVEDYTNNFDL